MEFCLEEEDIPFNIPNNWKWFPLFSICHINGGYAFKSIDYSDEGIRVVRISDFNNNEIINDKIIRHKYLKDLDAYEIKNKDILLCMTGGTVGKLCYVLNLKEKSYTNQRVAKIHPLVVNTKFVYYVLSSPLIQNIIKNKKNSTNDNISIDLIENFLIPIPPIEEQERIVSLLDNVLYLIESI